MKITKLRLKKLIKEEISGQAKSGRDIQETQGAFVRHRYGVTARPSRSELKVKINQLKKIGDIDDATWRQARRALYKDKTGHAAIQFLITHMGSLSAAEGALNLNLHGKGESVYGKKFDNPVDPFDPVWSMKEAKLAKITKNTLKQLIKEEFKALNERYQLPPIPRGMAYPDQDGIYPMSDDDGFPVYQSYPENIYEIPKYKQFFDWLDSQKPQGPPQLPPEEYFDPDPQPEPSIRMKENQEEGAWERAMASIRRLSDRAKTSGTALATKAGRKIKMHINQLKKDDMIDEPTWRKARRALYKDKTGDMAIRILVDAVGRGEVEGGLSKGFEDVQNDARGAAGSVDTLGRVQESKLTKSALKQLIKKELSEL